VIVIGSRLNSTGPRLIRCSGAHELTLHWRDPGKTTCCAGWPKEGDRHRCAQRVRSAALVKAQGKDRCDLKHRSEPHCMRFVPILVEGRSPANVSQPIACWRCRFHVQSMRAFCRLHPRFQITLARRVHTRTVTRKPTTRVIPISLSARYTTRSCLLSASPGTFSW